MANFNIQDQAVQEKIRRQPHAYVTGDGSHGTYVARPYLHQEYPKVMDKTPAPIRKAFKSDPEFQAALQEWNELVVKSTVEDKAAEHRWLKENGKAVKAA